MTWSALLAARPSESPAVVTHDGVWTSRELLGRAAAAAEWLDSIGAPAGGVVAALLWSTPDALALAVGAAASGRPLAPLAPRLTQDELVACLKPLDSVLLVADESAEALAEGVAAANGSRPAVLPSFGVSRRSLTFDQNADSLVGVLHTSGTTGLPRRVDMREDAMAARVEVYRRVIGLSADCVYASASGFHHVAGLGMQLAALGAGAAVAHLPRFDVESWLELGRCGVSHALLVPTMIERLLQAEALALPSLRVLQYGAAPIYPDTLARAMDALPNAEFVQVFGQTEGSPITYLSDKDHRVARDGRPELLLTVGRAVPETEIRIEGSASDGVGEVCARAPHMFRFDSDGWLRTGDLGRVDEAGFLHLTGRKGDKIVRGGENVYPFEIEAVLLQHPAVADVAVVGVQDRELGEVVRAHVVRNGTVSGDELRAFARERLAGFKVPTMWVFQAELPRSSLGKVLRRHLLGT